MLAPRLYMVAVKPRSAFMVRAAKARFTRSIRHQMNIRNRNGSRRHATLRMVSCSSVSAMVVPPQPVLRTVIVGLGMGGTRLGARRPVVQVRMSEGRRQQRRAPGKRGEMDQLYTGAIRGVCSLKPNASAYCGRR